MSRDTGITKAVLWGDESQCRFRSGPQGLEHGVRTPTPFLHLGKLSQFEKWPGHTARGLQRALAPYPEALPSPVSGACVATSRPTLRADGLLPLHFSDFPSSS